MDDYSTLIFMHLSELKAQVRRQLREVGDHPESGYLKGLLRGIDLAEEALEMIYKDAGFSESRITTEEFY